MSIKAISISEIHGFVEQNVCRPEGLGTDKETVALAKELAQSDGWDAALGVAIVEPMTADEITKAVIERQAAWDALLAKGVSDTFLKDGDRNVINIEIQRAWEGLYTAKGKVVAPKYKVVAGFRRCATWHVATAINKDLKAEVIADVREFKTADERFALQLRENLMKSAGSKAVSDAGILPAAKLQFQLGKREAEMGRILGIPAAKRGMLQKIFATVKADAEYKDLCLVERFVKGELPFEKFRAGDLGKAEKAGQGYEYCVNFATDGKAPEKGMSRKDLIGIKDQSPVVILKLIAEIVITNNVDALKVITTNAMAWNAATATLVQAVEDVLAAKR